MCILLMSGIICFFHLYDDRGADVVSMDKEILRPLYIKCNNFILDHDREDIDRVFAE